ncbi:hypothetical protein ABZ468_50215 [Streptomyces sp. NPDC005708]|uniref:RapZ C-terminal domain-containing protein n=1 Tax=Streptomyces sp. NPDC005708 TaxID=3154564 RepID=UPI0033E06AE4
MLNDQVIIESYGARWQDPPPAHHSACFLAVNLTDALLNPPDNPGVWNLRAHHNGLHPAIRHNILASPGAERIINEAVSRAQTLAAGDASEDLSPVRILVASWAGVHRGPAVAHEIGRRLRGHGITVSVTHRHIDNQPVPNAVATPDAPGHSGPGGGDDGRRDNLAADTDIVTGPEDMGASTDLTSRLLTLTGVLSEPAEVTGMQACFRLVLDPAHGAGHDHEVHEAVVPCTFADPVGNKEVGELPAGTPLQVTGWFALPADATSGMHMVVTTVRATPPDHESTDSSAPPPARSLQLVHTGATS